jgi:hypothetical protein
MRVLLASLFVLCAICDLAQSIPHNPQHTQDKSAQSQIRKAAEDKQISEKSETAVPPEINVSTNYYQDSDRNKGHSETAKVIGDFILAIFTLALVVVGVLQWRVLCKHAREREFRKAGPDVYNEMT